MSRKTLYDYMSPFLNGSYAIKKIHNHPVANKYEQYKSFFRMNECMMLLKDIHLITKEDGNTGEWFNFNNQTFATVTILTHYVYLIPNTLQA